MEFVLIDIKTSRLTFGEVMMRINEFRANPKYADCDVFIDGDKQAIMARTRD